MEERYVKQHNILVNSLLKDLKDSNYAMLNSEIAYDKILGYNKDHSKDPLVNTDLYFSVGNINVYNQSYLPECNAIRMVSGLWENGNPVIAVLPIESMLPFTTDTRRDNNEYITDNYQDKNHVYFDTHYDRGYSFFKAIDYVKIYHDSYEITCTISDYNLNIMKDIVSKMPTELQKFNMIQISKANYVEYEGGVISYSNIIPIKSYIFESEYLYGKHEQSISIKFNIIK